MSRKRDKGFVFTREMNFHDNDVSRRFLEFMFTKKYQNLENICNISTKEDFKNAILGCSDINKINEIWNSNFEKFLVWAKKQKSYIKEETSNDSVGSTLGELSLAYYKFQTYDSKEWDVLMIDQPEDNISNNRIASKLLQYFNEVRDNKQLILVTHNPLLVINLDADNVIHLKKMNDTITVTSGCLEDEDNNVLSLVAETLDGGKEMISFESDEKFYIILVNDQQYKISKNECILNAKKIYNLLDYKKGDTYTYKEIISKDKDKLVLEQLKLLFESITEQITKITTVETDKDLEDKLKLIN